MAVYERRYRKYRGAHTPTWSRFLVLPRYSYSELFRSRLFLLFYAAAAVLWPFVLAVLIYLPHNLGFLERLEVLATAVSAFFYDYGSEFFFFWHMVPSIFVAFFVALFVGPALISADLRNNGLPLYLSRPFSRAEYVLGKTTVLIVLLSGVTWIPGLVLFLLRSYFGGWRWFGANLRIGAAIFAGSWIWILVLCLLSLAISAYVKWKPIARIVLLVVFFVAGALAAVLNTILRTDWGSLLNIGELLRIVWAALFGIEAERNVPLPAAWAALLALCALCLLLLSRRVRAYEVVRS